MNTHRKIATCLHVGLTVSSFVVGVLTVIHHYYSVFELNLRMLRLINLDIIIIIILKASKAGYKCAAQEIRRRTRLCTLCKPSQLK